MAFQQLAPELVHQVYSTLSTISDVINLSLTCHRFNSLLRNAHKLSTLFAAADREFGPIHDIKMLVTYNHTVPAHTKRDPPMSYALLRQLIHVGMVGRKFEELYPSMRWQYDYMNRRGLSNHESRLVRQALYRYWLFCEAFQNRAYPRTYRLHPSAIEERCQLLRCWSTNALIELEDVRTILEDVLTFQICPTDGTVQQRTDKDIVSSGWHTTPDTYSRMASRTEQIQTLFHGAHDDHDKMGSLISSPQARFARMDGWGDEISQYYYVQSLMKLNPSQILWLHEHATYKWQVEAMVRELGEEWFWNNGQTFSDTWIRVLHARGEDIEDIRGKIYDCSLGAAVNSSISEDACGLSARE